MSAKETNQHIIQVNNFNIDTDLIFTKPKQNNQGGKSVGILNNATKKALYIETPPMMNWGVNVYENTNGNSYDTNIQFPREEYSNENIDNLLSKLIEFEKNIKNKAKENSKEWFGKTNMSDEVIDALWSPMLKYPKDTNGDPDYNRKPTIRIKLPMWENEPKFTLFNPKQEILVPNDEYIMVDNFIKKGSTIATIMMCGGIWFANGKFGVTWKLFQGVVQQVDDLQNNKCHINVSTYDSDGEDDIPNIEKLNIKQAEENPKDEIQQDEIPKDEIPKDEDNEDDDKTKKKKSNKKTKK
jgi:hypothetical protein